MWTFIIILRQLLGFEWLSSQPWVPWVKQGIKECGFFKNKTRYVSVRVTNPKDETLIKE